MTLSEDFFSLALASRRGAPCRLVDYALAATALRELAECGRIRIDGCRFAVLDDRPTGDAALDGALSALAHTDRCCSLRYWVRELGQAAAIRPALHARLEDPGAVCREAQGPSWASRRACASPSDTGPRAEAVKRLRAVLLDGAAADASTVTLVGMLKACRLVGTVLTRGDQRRAKHRIHELVESDPISRAAEAVVADVEVVKSEHLRPGPAAARRREAPWTHATR
jgi:golgi phosphoprotein 3